MYRKTLYLVLRCVQLNKLLALSFSSFSCLLIFTATLLVSCRAPWNGCHQFFCRKKKLLGGGCPFAPVVRHSRVGVALFSHLDQGAVARLLDLGRGGDGVLELLRLFHPHAEQKSNDKNVDDVCLLEL